MRVADFKLAGILVIHLRTPLVIVVEVIDMED
jgi:hypothetical protein